MFFSILTGIFIPVTFTVVSMKVTGVSYRTGLVCLPNHHKAIATFWAWEVGFAGAALLVQLITTGYCVWVFLRVLVGGKGKRDGGGGSDDGRETVAQERSGLEQSSFASQPSTGSEPAERSQKTWWQIRRILLMQWRHIALTVIMAVESLFYIIVFVAQDTRFGEAAANVDRPEARTWSACLLFNNGGKEACLQYAEELAIPRDLVLESLLLGSLIGTQNFFLLAKPSIFLGWWELLRHPFKRIPLLGRRDSDLPLTSLDPSERQAPAPGTTKATEAQDYSANGTTPLMTATNTSVPSRSSMFFGHRRPRSRSSRHSSSSSLHGVEVDMPPVTVTNPYKLSLPSERAASLIDPVERARLARTGDIVDLHNLYATDVRDDSAAFNAARPETPPPPPLPLSIAKSPTTSTKQPMATSAASLSLPSPTQSSSSSFRAADESSITPIAHARPLPRAHAHDNQILPSSSPSSSSSSSLPPSPATTTGLPTRSATVHHTPSPPPPSHTPDYLRPSRSSGNMATAFMGGDGVAANRPHHRLPSWAAHNGSSSTTLGRPSGGAGEGVGGAGTLVTTAELRDAMRGGLALHPVRANEFGEELGGGAGAGDGDGDGDGNGGGGGGPVVAGTGISDDDGDGGRSHAAEEDGGTGVGVGVGVGRARGDGAAGETAGMGGHHQTGEVGSGDSDGAFSSSGSDEVVDGRTRRRRKRRGG
ncbi:hypothetical protein DIS24_g971 [Lasiodiplodia hormozganensis]|uniref:Uncharacterized protein n=1 Tax=Lasiodiplodia hormozganensis TaxID=869390 RepID=A0AA39Z519_9PEZI|nr:hypothetical protein DIS24_g971 [Lasiodiplodia hormozganensis]